MIMKTRKLGGLGKVQITMDMLRVKNFKWWWGAISAAISLIVEAIFDMITLIMGRKNDGSTEA